MSDEAPPRPPYKHPGRLPREQRIGLTITEPGQPFEHFCAICGEDGGWGFGVPGKPELGHRWYCYAHRDQGEAWRTEMLRG
ncbi:hypothetical protein [Roseomonas elaeocarpi]|uniref:Molecular chaperone DnaJ n=1 Tax=Roseomonas elaeocarpi TaxID=907779 RepID=A0ABV6JPG1_9PROT